MHPTAASEGVIFKVSRQPCRASSTAPLSAWLLVRRRARIQQDVQTAAGSPVSQGNSGCLQKTESTTQHQALPSFKARGCGARLPHGPWGSGHKTVNPVAAVGWEKGIAESQARQACAC